MTLYGPKCVEINILILFLIDNITFSTLTNALSWNQHNVATVAVKLILNVTIHLCLWLLKQLLKKLYVAVAACYWNVSLAPLFEKSFLLDGSVKKFRYPSLTCFTKEKCPSLITKLCVIKQGLFFYVFYHKLLCYRNVV